MMNRRSFLSLLAAAFAAERAGASLVPAADPLEVDGVQYDSLPGPVPALTVGPRDFLIWDGAMIRPGERLVTRLFPPPVPREFLITHMQINFAVDATVRDVAAILSGGGRYPGDCNPQGALWVQMGTPERLYMQAPAYHLAWGSARAGTAAINDSRSYAFVAPSDFGVDLFTDGPAAVKAPVQVTVILKGQLCC